MKIKLHHVNFCTTDVAAMDAFYRDVLGLEPEPSLAASRVTTGGYAGEVAFVTDGQMQLHLAERDLGAGFRTGNAINPLRLDAVPWARFCIDCQELAEKGLLETDH